MGVLIVLAAATTGLAQPMPPQLSTLADRAKLGGPIAGWCRGTFGPGTRGGYAVAVRGSERGARYAALGDDGAVYELAPFADEPNLSCYTRAEADRVDKSIRQSETIEGGLTPRWRTTVVCGFVETTQATCWQYSPAERRFVRIGGWIT